MSTATPVPVLPQGQQSWFQRFLTGVKTKAEEFGTEISDFFTHQAFPFIENLLHQTVLDEIALAKPAFEEALKEVEADLPLVFTEPGKFMGLVTDIARSAWQKLEAQGIQVAETTLITGAQATLHNWIAANRPAA